MLVPKSGAKLGIKKGVREKRAPLGNERQQNAIIKQNQREKAAIKGNEKQ